MAILWGQLEPAAPPLMTADELFYDKRYQQGYELIEGRLVRMSPAGNLHGEIVQEFGRIIGNFVKPRKIGTVVAAETGFIVSKPGHPDTVLAPDVAFIRADRLPPRNSPERKKYLHLAPDLIVEVASPSEYHPEMDAKAQFWINAGVQLVWVAWPETQTVDVWQPGQQMHTLTADDMLDGYAVLPGFTQLICDLF
jgi:Uma2 family endonuclease